MRLLVCREVFGPEGRLMEILSEADQQLALEVIIAAEASFTLGDPQYSYWWTGLRDPEDDGSWAWDASE